MQRELPKPSPEKCAYFAGYTDAEGSINVLAANRGTTWTASVSFGQTRPAVLHELHALYGGTIRKVRAARLNWQSQEHWSIRRSSTVICFLQDVLPYLQEKRTQAELVINNFASRMEHARAEALRTALHKEKQREVDATAFATPLRPARTRTCGLCRRRSSARGLCATHYERERLRGTLPIRTTASKAFAYVRQPTTTDRAYAAGYFDGDGCYQFRLANNGYWCAFVSFGQTRPEGLQFLQGIYGGLLHAKKVRPPRRPQLAYGVQSRAAVMQFLADIQPYSVERRAEIDLLVQHLRPGMSLADGQALRDALDACS